MLLQFLPEKDIPLHVSLETFDAEKYPTWMIEAVKEAQKFEGATAPNPPVGALGLNSRGEILSVKAHEQAGKPHAEASVIADCRSRGILSELHTLVVTLEPCNHQGRTGPCTQAILETPIQRVIYGAPDPNPKVAGGGADFLIQNGVEVHLIDSLEARRLIRSFSVWSKTGIPFVRVKTAIDTDGSMIPPAGQKTFTSASSLKFAHELRRTADALITGSGTVLADDPQFTVRLVPDHLGKRRYLAVLDRRKRIPKAWVERQISLGFSMVYGESLQSILEQLGKLGCLEVLVEAGPALSGYILSSGMYHEHVVIKKGSQGRPRNPDDLDGPDDKDVIETRELEAPCLPELFKT